MTKRKMKRSSRVYQIKRANAIVIVIKVLMTRKKQLETQIMILILVKYQ